ncbi:MAG: phosphomannomutase/phosphoglucomutase [Candidatus Nealsonbacteria bacterium]|nr:phosphomannomutase/phosphoglucomutase [Candidatus Nealsonbacteria bacterium]
MVNPNIFKAYDIRGIYPQEINGQTAYKIGQAFVKFLCPSGQAKIAVGRDNRLSSPVLHKNLIKGLSGAGALVFDFGLSPTPMLCWACAHYGYDGGINITASHNPKEYNGFKLVREKAIPIGGDSGLQEIKNLTTSRFTASKFIGKVIRKKVIQDYVKFSLSRTDFSKAKSLKIAVDTANAVPGILISELARKVPYKIYHIFKELDGNFPNHPPNPLIEENLKSLCYEVKKRKADLGIAFDGDGDRIFFVDEKNKIVPSDILASLLSELILKEKPGSKILYDVRCGRIIEEIIENNGGLAVIWKVGHAFIKEKMRKENIVFGAEFSGHFYLKDYYFCEAPLFILSKIIEAISKSGKTFSQLLRPYYKYYHSGEINFEVEDKFGKIKELKKRFSSGKILEIDGLRIDFKDWWFSVRSSNTESLLRLVLEADTEELLNQKKKELTTLISDT